MEELLLMPFHHKVMGAVKQIGSKAIAGAKELGQSSAVGISAAKEMVEGAVMPTASQITQFGPTPEGKKYLEEMMGSGDVSGTGHWAYEMLSPPNQTTQAYVSRMMEQHKYQGDRNQLVKNINEMLASGYIQSVPTQSSIPGITVGPEETAKTPQSQQGPKTRGTISHSKSKRILPKIETGRLTKRL